MLRKWDHGVLKIISSGYFHEDHLKGIIYPKFQLSIISSWRDIADFKIHKIQTKILQTRISICCIFLDFYVTELKLSEIEEWTVTFVMNRKKTFLGVIIFRRHLESTFFSLKFYRNLGSIPQKTHASFSKAIHQWKSHLSLYQISKNILELSSYTEKINLKVALFLKCKT